MTNNELTQAYKVATVMATLNEARLYASTSMEDGNRFHVRIDPSTNYDLTNPADSEDAYLTITVWCSSPAMLQNMAQYAEERGVDSNIFYDIPRHLVVTVGAE